MNAEAGDIQPRCPICRVPLLCVGTSEISINEADARRRHAYWCPSGCRGPEPDGTFEFIECPVCGSHDTLSTPRGDSVEELECNACDTITTMQMVPSRA
jgi:hypothetical protein